jgi:hypothetical protein
MSPRSLRVAIVALLLFSVLSLAVSFPSNSAAVNTVKAARVAQQPQVESTNRKQGPPNYDAFGASKKRPAAVADAQAQVETSEQQIGAGHIVQVEPRLGVPTFLWASETGQGKARHMSSIQAQANIDVEASAREHLGDYSSLYRLSASDVSEAQLVAVHDSGKGAVIAKFKQEVKGVEVFRDEINVIMNRDLQLVALSGYLTGDNTGAGLTAEDFKLQPGEALSKALEDLTGTTLDASAFQGTKSSAIQKNASNLKNYNSYLLYNAPQGLAGKFSFADEQSRVKKVMFHLVDEYVPAYYVETSILLPSTDVLSVSGDAPLVVWSYSYVISAVDGQVLYRNNLVDDAAAPNTPYTYRVWADPATHIPYDTPAGNGPHPKQTTSPDAAQSPFGAQNDVTLTNYAFSRNDPWLPAGATETVGNNVDAFVNLFNPDGYGPVAVPANPATGDFRAQLTGPEAFLHVHTPDSQTLTTAEARQGTLQQFFYDVNFLHDWFYDAGFDEAAGNAQTDNYGRGGLGNDSIKAQAQDVAGRNNANMMTPADGARPRMRMYVFDTAAVKYVDVLNPSAIAGQRAVGTGQFGAQSFDVTGDVFRPNPAGGCTAASFTGVAGKIVLVDREPTTGTGSCSIGTKLNNAMAAGASGFILVNLSSTSNSVVTVTGSLPTFTIPFLSVSWNSAAGIKTQLAASQTVNLRMRRDAGSDRDGAIDNQLVFHEWAHYITNRLIGNANGLNTNHAAGLGEGWGDFNAMLLTVREDDLLIPSNANWNGTYALATYATSGSGNNGYYFGIRRYPYSTDMTRNPLTYKHIQDGVALPSNVPVNNNGLVNSEIHNTGEVWTTMLWECYASLLRDSGRLNFQEAQERMKYYLVAAYKMTPVDPTLLEARDALLAAAFAYDEIDGQLFLQAFAKRGAGPAAVAPDRYSQNNSGVVESFSSTAQLTFVNATLDDSVEGCDNDGYLDNGEKGLLKVTIKNTGSNVLGNTTATVSSSNPGLTFPDNTTISFPSSVSGQSVTASLPVAAGGLSGIHGTDFTIEIQDSNQAAPVNITGHYLTHLNVDETLAASATDDVEANQSAWTIGGTSTNVITGSELIQTKSDTAKWRRVAAGSTNYLWHGPDVGIGADQHITSPVMTVDGSGSLQMQFDHSFGFEFDGGGNYDGGVVEMSVNGGAWTDMGSSVYNGTILNYSGSSNPLKGRPAFVKNSSGLMHASIAQAVAPGSTVQVRFRIGSDGGVGSTGWQVDNIALSGVVETPFAQLVADAGVCRPAVQQPSPILLSPGALPSGIKGTAYASTQITSSGGTAPYTYSLTPFALPTGLVYDMVGGSLQISGTPTRLGNFPVTILATDSAGHQASANYTITINKPTPTIVWANPADINFGTPLSATELNATANVPGSFTYSPATGSILNAGAGQTLTVNFTPTDTANYNSASKSVSINVLKANQTITFGTLQNKTFGDGPFTVSATASSNLPVSFQIVSGPATISGNTATITGAGTVVVRALQAGDANYNAATNTDQSFTVDKAAPAITWNNPADISYGIKLDSTQLNATASVPGTFTYTPAAGTVTGVGSNQTLSVNFTPTGAANYNTASKSVSINVLKAAQTITFGTLSNKLFRDVPFNVSATASSNLPVSFQIISGPATIAGGSLTITGAGTVVVRASQAGDANYQAAVYVDQSFTVGKATPVLTWNNPANITYGKQLNSTELNATTSVPGIFTYTPAAGATLGVGSNQTLSVNFAPTEANNYAAATKSVQINVLKADQTITFNALSNKTYGDAPFTLSATASSNLPVSFLLVSGPATINGNTLTINGAGTVVVRATQAGNTGFNAGAPVDLSFTVTKAAQTITFDLLSDKAFGDTPFGLSASASSGLGVSYRIVSGPATLSGNTLTITGAGVVTVRAAQDGNNDYSAAIAVERVFNVGSAHADIALSNLSHIYDGTAQSAAAVANPAGLNVQISYQQNGVAVTPLNAGSYDVTATVNDANYQGTATATLLILKATPVINWNAPANISFGTPLGSAQLNATSNVPGAFNYTPQAGTLFSEGSYQLSAMFTPTDAANYETASKTLGLTVEAPSSAMLSFSSTSYNASEGSGHVSIVVNRGGDISGPAAVSYATSDFAGLTNCNVANGISSSRCDYATTVGTLRFAAGESTQTIYIPLVDDVFVEGGETFTLTLREAVGASLSQANTASISITDNDAATTVNNPSDQAAFFIRQHYIDFLGREPDQAGYPVWQNILNNCQAGDTACDRVEVSSGFFRSEEFQSRGYFIYRFYSTLGRIPRYDEFLPELAKVSGFLSPSQLEINKGAFLEGFMAAPEFQDKYGSLTDAVGYVDALLRTTGLLNHPTRETWINALSEGKMTRAEVLRGLVESSEANIKFYTEAFVVMQYFGYLRRDPDINYLEWIKTMEQMNGDYRTMINGFVNSAEYRQRFGQ